MVKPCKHPCCPDSGPCRKAKSPQKRKEPIKRKETRQKSPQINKNIGKARKPQEIAPNRPKIAKIAKSNVPKYREYAKNAKIYRQNNPLCMINAPGCTRFTEGVHHVKGKIGDLLLDETHWMPACNWCNNWIEANSERAFELGLKKSKHEPNYKRKK